MSLRLDLPMPPTINHYWRYGARGRVYISDKGVDFRREVLRRCASPVLLFPSQRLSMSVTLHADSKRRYDLDNRIKCLQDALQKARVYADDAQIDELLVRRGAVRSKGNACCVVELEVRT